MSPNASNRSARTVRLGLITMAATSVVVARAFQVLPVVRSTGAFTAVSRCQFTNTGRRAQKQLPCLPLAPMSRSAFTMARFMSQATSLTNEQRTDLESKIKAKGDEIRTMKENGVSKDDLAPHVAELLNLKSQLDPSAVSPAPSKKDGKKAQEAKKPSNTPDTEESDYITSRAENYSKWYNDIIRVCDLAEVSPVRGCMVIKPW
jgi:hypothetical protein